MTRGLLEFGGLLKCIDVVVGEGVERWRAIREEWRRASGTMVSNNQGGWWVSRHYVFWISSTANCKLDSLWGIQSRWGGENAELFAS